MIGQLLLSIILFSKWWSAWTALQVRLHTPIKERRSGTVQTQPCPYGVVAEELSEFRGTREARARAAIWRWQWLPIISGITRSTRDWMLESCSCCHLCQVGLIIPYLLVRARASPWQTWGNPAVCGKYWAREHDAVQARGQSFKRHRATSFCATKVSKT